MPVLPNMVTCSAGCVGNSEALAQAIASPDASGGNAQAAAQAIVSASGSGGASAQAAAEALATASKKSEWPQTCVCPGGLPILQSSAWRALVL